MRNQGQVYGLHTEPGGLGLSCGERGPALAGVRLLRRSQSGFEPRPEHEVQFLLTRAYNQGRDWSALSARLAVIARALNDGDAGKAMLSATFLQLADLDWAGAARIAAADDLLAKAYNPEEPRDWRGWWTTDGEGAVGPDSSLREDVAYQGGYHDEVVEKLARIARANGWKVVTEVTLVGVDGSVARADILGFPPSGILTLVEVKTGLNPFNTLSQRRVYPLAMLGEHVYSPDPKIFEIGLVPGEMLPKMEVYTLYKKRKKTPPVIGPNPSPF